MHCLLTQLHVHKDPLEEIRASTGHSCNVLPSWSDAGELGCPHVIHSVLDSQSESVSLNKGTKKDRGENKFTNIGSTDVLVSFSINLFDFYLLILINFLIFYYY